MVYRLNCNRIAQLHRKASIIYRSSYLGSQHSLLHTHTHENVLKSKSTMCKKKVPVNLATPVVSGGNENIFFTDQFKKACIITGGSTHSMSQIQEEKNNCCVCLKQSQTNRGQG